jgi:hypothetical protein
MPTEQLFQRPAVRTGRFNITDFATYTTQATVIKQNLQTESNTSGTYKCVRHYTQYNIHYTRYPCIIHCALYGKHYTQYPMYSTLYTIFLSTKHILLLCPIHKIQYKFDNGAAS